MNMDEFSVESSGPNFFCSSLRQRDEWAAATAELLRSSAAEILQSGESKWQGMASISSMGSLESLKLEELELNFRNQRPI